MVVPLVRWDPSLAGPCAVEVVSGVRARLLILELSLRDGGGASCAVLFLPDLGVVGLEGCLRFVLGRCLGLGSDVYLGDVLRGGVG